MEKRAYALSHRVRAEDILLIKDKEFKLPVPL